MTFSTVGCISVELRIFFLRVFVLLGLVRKVLREGVSFAWSSGKSTGHFFFLLFLILFKYVGKFL